VSEVTQAIKPTVAVIDEVMIEKDGNLYTPACFEIRDSDVPCATMTWFEEGILEELGIPDEKNLAYFKEINGIPENVKLTKETKFLVNKAYRYTTSPL
ncbi:MAG: hypothetical protein LC677_14975, partial [Halomonas sp.]|nr:hypothetical protein [Halomonas sp.]